MFDMQNLGRAISLRGRRQVTRGATVRRQCGDRSPVRLTRSLRGDDQVHRLGALALLVGLDIEGDALALGQRLEPRPLHSMQMAVTYPAFPRTSDVIGSFIIRKAANAKAQNRGEPFTFVEHWQPFALLERGYSCPPSSFWRTAKRTGMSAPKTCNYWALSRIARNMACKFSTGVLP